MKKRIFSGLLVLSFWLFSAMSAQAFDFFDHVYEAPNGVGDALIMNYLAADSVGTRIRIINTSSTHSIVAKLVFREGASSCEVLDFLIYLTPNDVWIGTVEDVNGVITVFSDDDSSPQVPAAGVAMTRGCNDYDPNMGHLEVYGALTFNNFGTFGAVSGGNSNFSLIKQSPLDKSLLMAAYGAALGVTAAGQRLEFNIDGVAYGATVNPSQDVMAGYYDIGDGQGVRIETAAVALANNRHDTAIAAGGQGKIDTRWDEYGKNTIHELRAALAKEIIHVPFDNSTGCTYVLLNWPMKLSCCRSTDSYCDNQRSECDLTTAAVAATGDECLSSCSGGCVDIPATTVDGVLVPGEVVCALAGLAVDMKDCLYRKESATGWAARDYDLSEHSPGDVFSPGVYADPIDVEVLFTSVRDFQGMDLTVADEFGTEFYNAGWIRMAFYDCLSSQMGGMVYRGTQCVDCDDSVFYRGSAMIADFVDFDPSDLPLVRATWEYAPIGYYATEDRGPIYKGPLSMSLELASRAVNPSFATDDNIIWLFDNFYHSTTFMDHDEYTSYGYDACTAAGSSSSGSSGTSGTCSTCNQDNPVNGFDWDDLTN
jgi:hypothetical protein